MLNRSNIQWSGKTLYNMVTKGKVNFDNYVQRHYVWDDARKSLFIHSLLTGYPVPPFFAAKSEDQYSLLDGLQRSMDAHIRSIDDISVNIDDLPEITDDDITAVG